jgi:hypothetical protein
MFKKFAIFLTPFMLAPFGSFFTPSEAHAQTSYTEWSQWDNCRFSIRDYTPVSVGIERRYSDFAGRAMRVRYGNGNSERIAVVEVWESRTISGQPTQNFPSQTLTTGNQFTYISPIFSPPRQFISNLGVRYIYARLTNADGRKCISQFSF